MVTSNQTARPTQQTFAARRSVIFPTRWTIATCSAARRIATFAFAVAATVVLRTLAHI